MARHLLFALALLTVGCGPEVERTIRTSFEPVGTERFAYRVESWCDGCPGEYSEAEMEVMAAEWVRLNRMCPNGYDLVSKQRVLIENNWYRGRYRLLYQGACKA